MPLIRTVRSSPFICTLLSSLIELLPLILGVHVGLINLISKNTGSISATVMSIILILFLEGLFLGACVLFSVLFIVVSFYPRVSFFENSVCKGL